MFAIKSEINDTKSTMLAFSEQKTMYGGKHIDKGDRIFVCAGES